MITIEQYFGEKINHPDATPERQATAETLLVRVNSLLWVAAKLGHYQHERDPDTGTQISGARNGFGDGGFRLLSTTTGMFHSDHKLGGAVDVYDPFGQLNAWLTDEILAVFGLYREDPAATPGWCHLQLRAPRSGKRTFWP